MRATRRDYIPVLINNNKWVLQSNHVQYRCKIKFPVDTHDCVFDQSDFCVQKGMGTKRYQLVTEKVNDENYMKYDKRLRTVNKNLLKPYIYVIQRESYTPENSGYVWLAINDWIEVMGLNKFQKGYLCENAAKKYLERRNFKLSEFIYTQHYNTRLGRRIY